MRVQVKRDCGPLSSNNLMICYIYVSGWGCCFFACAPETDVIFFTIYGPYPTSAGVSLLTLNITFAVPEDAASPLIFC